MTRLDISYVVGLLNQFMHEPRMVHWKGALRVLAYIERTLDRGLIYQKHEHLHVEAYSESNYVGDKGDRKSTFGYCTYV